MLKKIKRSKLYNLKQIKQLYINLKIIEKYKIYNVKYSL